MKTKRPPWFTTSLLFGLISMGLAPAGKAGVVYEYSGATFKDFSGSCNSLAETNGGSGSAGDICSPFDGVARARYSGNELALTEPDAVPEPQCTALLTALLVVLAVMLRKKRDLVV
jgi:hypothetical protein